MCDFPHRHNRTSFQKLAPHAPLRSALTFFLATIFQVEFEQAEETRLAEAIPNQEVFSFKARLSQWAAFVVTLGASLATLGYKNATPSA
jgi:hypothetical protein